MPLRFVHSAPHGTVTAELDALLSRGTEAIRAAFCYFSAAGSLVMQRHARALTQPQSFVVISCDKGTNLDAAELLYDAIPGHLYIHLGWATPEEKKVGSALMHSKVCLVRGAGYFRGLWVGSHNLTARALTGANLEAALVYESTAEDAVFLDADVHVEQCRTEAELFDPARMEFYRSLQANRPVAIGLKGSILCIHAEEHERLSAPAVVHMRLATTEFDGITRTDTPVHLFVYPPGSLAGRATLHPATRLYTGKVIEDNRTELHPGGGSASELRRATHWLNADTAIPRIVAVGTTGVRPVTQAAIMLDQQSDPADYLYSLKLRRVRTEAFAIEGQGFAGHFDVPDEMFQFFTSDSFDNEHLYFTPRQQLMKRALVSVYKGTPVPERFHPFEQEDGERPLRPLHREAPRDKANSVRVELVRRPPENPLASYIFQSTFRLCSEEELIS